MERRKFLHRSAASAAACACGSLLGCSTVNAQAKVVTAAAPSGGRVALGKSSDLAVGGQLKVTVPGLDAPVLVAKIAENDVKAVSIACSHFGSELELVDDGFRCPNHGSRFAYDGSVVGGPADEPVPAYPVVNEGGELFLFVE